MRSDLEHSALVAQRLRELPVELEPPMSWAAFQHRMEERAAKAKPQQRWPYAALAASIAALVAGLAVWSRMSPPNHESGMADTRSQTPMLVLPDSRALRQAEASERWLARLPAEPAVIRLGTRSAVADLEDRIAFMDDVLSDEGLNAVNPTHLLALRHERARLVNSLAQVRYAETLAAGVP